MDMNQYMDMFIEESKEHLQACNEHLLELEKNPEDLAIVNEIFRSAHTLKGMSATMGYEDIAELTHVMENILDAIRNSKLSVTAEILDAVFESVVYLEQMVYDIEAGGDGKKDVSTLVALLNRIEAGDTNVSLAHMENAVTLDVEKEAVSNSVHYDEFEMTVMSQSFEQGFGAFEITVSLRDDCLLKAARVFMVFEILESAGDIIKSEPAVDRLEDEDFDSQFTAVLISKEDVDVIKAKIMKVSEIEEVHIKSITNQYLIVNKRSHDKERIEVEVSTKKEEVVVGSKPNATPNNRVQAQSSNRTIRVNIERLDILMNLFEELVIDRGRLQSIADEMLHPELTETVERITRVSGDLQNIILNMRTTSYLCF